MGGTGKVGEGSARHRLPVMERTSHKPKRYNTGNIVKTRKKQRIPFSECSILTVKQMRFSC